MWEENLKNQGGVYLIEGVCLFGVCLIQVSLKLVCQFIINNPQDANLIPGLQSFHHLLSAAMNWECYDAPF